MKLRIDPRWYVLVNNALLLVLGMVFFGLQRDLVQVGFCFALGIATELLCDFLFKKHGQVRVKDRILSAAVACVSTLILIRSSDWWFYGLLAVVAIASKYLLVDERGRHFFNPTNLAIVFSLAFMPDHLFVRPDQFSMDQLTFYICVPMVIGFGVLAMLGAHRWRLTLAYYLTVAGFGVPIGLLLHVKPQWVLAPELNTSTLIFSFLMQTDPRTTPSDSRAQFAFGACVALLHLTLRYQQVPYSPFVSLFVVTGLWSLVGRAVAAPKPVPNSSAAA
jgi:Na+-translocating ferredoxin:NAD+ oxidoreductase RnfD subunit